MKKELESKLDYMRCGECLHFKKSCHPNKDDICSKLGVKAFNKAPSKCFTPNVMELVSNSEQLAVLTNLWNSYSHKQRRIFSHLLSKKKSNKKFKFGKQVFFKMVGKDYLSNYVSGYVIGYSSTGDMLVCGDPDKNSRGSSYVAHIKKDTPLLSREEFKKKKLLLVKKNRLLDPDKPLLKFNKTINFNDYTPPTIDSAPKRKEQRGKKKKLKSVDDIITITS